MVFIVTVCLRIVKQYSINWDDEIIFSTVNEGIDRYEISSLLPWMRFPAFTLISKTLERYLLEIGQKSSE